MEGVFFPRETYAKVVAYLVGRPYGEVAATIKAMEATCFDHSVTVNPAPDPEAGNGPGV